MDMPKPTLTTVPGGLGEMDSGNDAPPTVPPFRAGIRETLGAPSATGAQNYEELTGGLGRNILYRPTRYRVRDLLKGQALALRVDGTRRILDDIAMSGLSYRAPKSSAEYLVGQQVEMALSLEDVEVYSGVGSIARIDDNGSSIRVGVKLLTGFIDVPRLVGHYDAMAFADQLRGGALRLRAAVPAAYREVVEEASHFVKYYKSCLDAQVERVRLAGNDLESQRELAQQTFDALRGEWRDLCRRATVVSHEARQQPGVRAAMKQYTEVMLTRDLLRVPIVRQAYNKPLGYPGDFNTMLQIYRNAFEGESAFEQVFHRLFCEDPMAAGVRGRRDILKSLQETELQRVREARGTREPFRVLSIGCGPAREVGEFIEEHRVWRGEIKWVLVDQEQAALSEAYANAYRALATAEGKGTVSCLYLSFTQMVSANDNGFTEDGQDLIYVSGLVDYLPSGTAHQLVSALFDRLRPGGCLAIGNALRPNPYVWACEYILDWSLVYRTPDELIGLGEPVASRSSYEFVAEDNGVFGFLLIRKH